MARHDLWEKMGFTGNPYTHETLPATQVGAQLLAGRDALVTEVMEQIGTEGVSPTFEGPVGAGKTSLLNVASYKLYAESLQFPKGKELWLPAVDRIQMSLNEETFEAEVYRIVLQTLIANKDAFRAVGLIEPKLDALDHWLNRPEFRTWQAGGGIALVSASAGTGTAPNETIGFSESGLPAAIRKILADAYKGGHGGVICILDNLELAGSVGAASKVLDTLRDRILGVTGIRWVLCGSRGIVSRARTQRLAGYFPRPTMIPVLPEDAAVEAVRRRLELHAGEGAVPPLTPEAFRKLYRILNHNLRDTMTWAQSFSRWLYNQFRNETYPDVEDRDAFLVIWLAERSQEAMADVRAQPAAWTFFDRMCREGKGRAASAEFEPKYGFEDQQQGSSYVTVFANANLIQRETDPEDGRGTINVVTAEGWLVFFHRNDYEIETPGSESA